MIVANEINLSNPNGAEILRITSELILQNFLATIQTSYSAPLSLGSMLKLILN